MSARAGNLPLHAALALAAALAAAGCSVNVDGAPCAIPSETGDCPDGQACGNDLRCSARALACAASRCTPGATGCVDPTRSRRCTGADPVCGRWELDDCGARGMICPGLRSRVCECDPQYAGTTLVADPGGSPDAGAAPFPTGQQDLVECRFGRLWDALAAASALAPSAATVQLDAAAATTIVFGPETGESWPLVVASNVSVVGAAAPAGPAVIRGEPGAARIVEVRGALEAVRVEGHGATGIGVALSCGAGGRPELRRVTVDGGGIVDPIGLSTVTGGLLQGVLVEGACSGARLLDVEVASVAGRALEIDPEVGATVDVLGGRYDASNVGIWIRGGKVSVQPDPETLASVVVSGNSAEGVFVGGRNAQGLTPNDKLVDAALSNVVVAGNGGTGLDVAGLPTTSRLTATRCDVHGNGATRAAWYGSGAGRRAGGVLVSQIALAEFTFLGNRLWLNAGDQLAFQSDATNWRIAASECGPDTNVFCAAEGAYAAALVGNGSVAADWNAWPHSPPDAYVNAKITFTHYCAPIPTCP